MIISTNLRKEKFKANFLKKFFPKLRMYTDDILTSMKVYFTREEYHKNSRVYIDGEFDEYVYIVVSGTFGAVKVVNKIKGLKEKFTENVPKYVLLEKLSKSYINIREGRCFWCLFSTEAS
jgi:hypothetical protein